MALEEAPGAGRGVVMDRIDVGDTFAAESTGEKDEAVKGVDRVLVLLVRLGDDVVVEPTEVLGDDEIEPDRVELGVAELPRDVGGRVCDRLLVSDPVELLVVLHVFVAVLLVRDFHLEVLLGTLVLVS